MGQYRDAARVTITIAPVTLYQYVAGSEKGVITRKSQVLVLKRL